MTWAAGDPCASCGSTDTWEDIVEGGQCNGCGRGDHDETPPRMQALSSSVPSTTKGTRNG